MALPRMLHCTHWGMVCPAETPEGHAVGIVKNLSLMSYVSVGVSPRPVIEFLDALGMLTLEDVRDVKDQTKIFVNGNWVGMHTHIRQTKISHTQYPTRNTYITHIAFIAHMPQHI